MLFERGSDNPDMKTGVKILVASQAVRSPLFLALIAGALVGVAACGKSEFSGSSKKLGGDNAIKVSPTPLPTPTPFISTDPADMIQSIEITPASAVVTVNATHAFKAFATYSQSGRREVTAQGTWSAAVPTKAASQGNGVFKGLAVGSTPVEVALDGKTATAALQVASGVAAQRVGVNFEDHPFTGDKDFNDAVLCFVGKVAVSAGAVVALEDQTITGIVSKRSLCDADMTIRIIGPGSYSWVRQFRASQQPTYPMPFKAGSRLEVIFNPAAGCGDNGRTPVSMYNPQWARILPNVCNTTGN